MLAAVRRALLVLVSLAAWPAAAASLPSPRLAPDADPEGAEGDDLPAPDRLRRPALARPRRTRACACCGAAARRLRRACGATARFRIPVELASPGPFHVAWLTATSNEVTVRIRPRLDAQLVGSRVAGAPLRLEAALDPPQPGRSASR